MTKGKEYLVNLFEQKVNTVLDIEVDESGTICFMTMPGSSLISEIQAAFKEESLNKIYDVEDIEFVDYGNQHEYNISLLN